MVVVNAAGLFAGLALLLVGADRTVRSAAELALYYGVSTFFVGVTVISVGTSIPEMTTSVYAATYGAGDLLVGNIVGSETAQITLAIGIVALISPIAAERRNVLIYGGAMVLAMVIMILTLEDGITRSEGVLMMLAYLMFIHDLYSTEGGEGISVGSLLGSNITDPVFSLGVGALVADVTLADPAAVAASVTYMLVVSLVVLGLLYWRRGIGRRSALVCMLLYLPSLALF